MSEKKTFAEKAKEYPFLVPGILSAWLLWVVANLYVAGYFGQKVYLGLLGVPFQLYPQEFYSAIITGGLYFKVGVYHFSSWHLFIFVASFIAAIRVTIYLHKIFTQRDLLHFGHRIFLVANILLSTFLIIIIFYMPWIIGRNSGQFTYEHKIKIFNTLPKPITKPKAGLRQDTPYHCVTLKSKGQEKPEKFKAYEITSSEKYISLAIPQPKASHPKIVTYPMTEIAKLESCRPWAEAKPTKPPP